MMGHRMSVWHRQPDEREQLGQSRRRRRRRAKGLIGRFARAKARAQAQPKKTPRKYRRMRPLKRSKVVGKRGRQGGGGWHRAAVGDYLRGLPRDSDARSVLFTAANAYAREVCEAQDGRFEKYCALEAEVWW